MDTATTMDTEIITAAPGSRVSVLPLLARLPWVSPLQVQLPQALPQSAGT
jgi:hypothetical protein